MHLPSNPRPFAMYDQKPGRIEETKSEHELVCNLFQKQQTFLHCKISRLYASIETVERSENNDLFSKIKCIKLLEKCINF